MSTASSARAQRWTGARPQGSWWPTDALRVVALVSVPLAWYLQGFASGACLFLVLGGAMLLRALALPQVIDALCQIAFLTTAWAAVMGMYETVPWVDIPAHVLGTAGATLIAWRLVVRFDPGHAGPGVSAWSTLWHLASLAALLSVLWEIGEWVGHTFISRDILVGYDDTIGDLTVGVVGGALLALPLARRLERE